MSIDYMLLRIHSYCDPEALNELQPFGSQQEIIAHLCAVPEFKLNSLESRDPIPPDEKRTPWATMLYKYRHKNSTGRVIQYSMQEDPIACISIRQAYPEDLLPVIDALKELGPFSILGSEGFIDPKSLFYSLDEWLQKNYEESEPLDYEGEW